MSNPNGSGTNTVSKISDSSSDFTTPPDNTIPTVKAVEEYVSDQIAAAKQWDDSTTGKLLTTKQVKVYNMVSTPIIMVGDVIIESSSNFQGTGIATTGNLVAKSMVASTIECASNLVVGTSGGVGVITSNNVYSGAQYSYDTNTVIGYGAMMDSDGKITTTSTSNNSIKTSGGIQATGPITTTCADDESIQTNGGIVALGSNFEFGNQSNPASSNLTVYGTIQSTVNMLMGGKTVATVNQLPTQYFGTSGDSVLEITDENIVVLNLEDAGLSTRSHMFSPLLCGNTGLTLACIDVPDDASTAKRIEITYDNITNYADTIINGNLTVSGTINGSNTLTHNTNIIDFTPQTIGCFAESTGQLADVYGQDYIPTLDRATDAIVKVKPSTTLNPAILGIITDSHTFANSGDVLCVVVQSDATTYAVGDMLTPDSSGLCRKASDEERRYIKNHGLPRVRITALFPGKEFVACFIQ
jgi:hypothetical protein